MTRFQGLYQSRRLGWGYVVANSLIIAPLHASAQVLSKKFLSDALNAGAGTIQHLLAPALSSVTGLSRIHGAPRVGEVPHVWASMGEAFDQAWKDAMDVAKGGTSRNEAYPDHARVSPLIAKTMPGSSGRGVAHAVGYASILTPVRIVHSLMSTTTGRLKVAAHAYRTAFDADGKRLTGNALDKHMLEEISNPVSTSWQRATLDAQRATFTEPLPDWIRRFARYLSTPGSTRFESGMKLAAHSQLPFIGIPFNRAKQALLNWSPIISDLGDLARFALAKDKLGNHYLSARDIPERIVQAGMRWALGYGVYQAMHRQAPDHHPEFIGNDRNPNLRYTAWTGTHRRHYLELGSLGPGLGLMADYWHGLDHGGIHQALAGTASGLAALSGEYQEPLVAPITQTVRDFQSQPRGRAGLDQVLDVLARKIGSTVGNLSPALSRQVQNAMRDTVPDYRYSQTAHSQFFADLWHAFQESVAPASLPDKHRGGKPVLKDADTSHAMTILDRLFNPIKLTNQRPREQ
jgi:hypothetical protein